MATHSHKRTRRPRGRERCALDEALRIRGLDENGYAETLGGFFDQLEGQPDIPKLKLMLDGLKELGRHLEPKRSGAAEADAEAPAVIQLVHSVERPSHSHDLAPGEAPSATEQESPW
jgi:hypothetical protein